MGRISGRTVAYAAIMLLIVIAVAYLMTRVARTEMANRRLITIVLVMAGAILVGGIGVLGLRGRRSETGKEDEPDG